jgi:hypothetical protein
MPVEMERGAVSARGAKSAEPRARIEASIFFTPARQPYCAARWRIYLASKGLLHCAPVVCLPLLGDQPQHVSRVVFRSAGLRLPAFCPAWNNSRATADRER